MQHLHGRYNGSADVSTHNHIALDIVNAAGMDETYGTYVDDERFDIHDYDDDTDHDTGDDTDDDTDDDANDDATMVGAGTCIQSRLKDQGPCPGTNEHLR